MVRTSTVPSRETIDVILRNRGQQNLGQTHGDDPRRYTLTKAAISELVLSTSLRREDTAISNKILNANVTELEISSESFFSLVSPKMICQNNTLVCLKLHAMQHGTFVPEAGLMGVSFPLLQELVLIFQSAPTMSMHAILPTIRRRYSAIRRLEVRTPHTYYPIRVPQVRGPMFEQRRATSVNTCEDVRQINLNSSLEDEATTTLSRLTRVAGSLFDHWTLVLDLLRRPMLRVE